MSAKEQFDSHWIESNQSGPHKNLEALVRKHIATEFKQPYRDHNLKCFSELLKAIEQTTQKRLILDSCCGTGMSTRKLAVLNPDALVVGLDQSEHRLNKKSELTDPPNCLFFRSNCEDIWRLCVENSVVFDEHFILYPNPYPKSVHVKRRWHGHPVFPELTKIAKLTNLRSNWKLYLEEFSFAWEIALGIRSEVIQIDVSEPLTLFERKYTGSKQAVYQLVLQH